MKKYHWKKIRHTEFANIKKLLDAQIPVAMVSKATNRSFYVIQCIARAKTLEEYRRIMSANGAKKKTKQSNIAVGTPEYIKPEERFPRIVTLLDTIVKQQLVILQDTTKIKRRLLILK